MSQLSLLDIPEHRRRIYRISRRAHRKRLPVLQPYLPVADDTFKPVAGVPRTRAQCPDTSTQHCPHVRCKWHLFLETGEHRAGRPGLASVPRDERGLTIATDGHVGNARPGTTLRPAWLTYRGLEVERECKVYVERDYTMVSVRTGALAYWLERLHMGEPVLVFDGDTAELLARAKLTADGLALDRDLPPHVFAASSALVLTRVREVASCALDEIDRRGRMSNTEVGDCIGRHRTLTARIVPRAFEKAKAQAMEMFGMSEADLLRGLRELGAGS